FIKNISIESPPLTPDKPVAAEDLVSADGACGTVALGHTECDVVRGIGAPSDVSVSNDAAGRRVAVVTWTTGPRAGIYTFVAGRLSSIEGNPEPQPVPRAAKGKKKQA
ncbi:MAG: hypothetical protein JHD07_16845, partial [Bradyrhizobium sp.]|uniref:hypothetical protein n=1 Tax=Bradyrhizobium sp. TaxID=376 RepID=UPI001A354A3B